ncbi:MAG: DinB family protein [Anaerolineales bacterium]|nr:DinB family protein [Anaerolineales bacterium]
MSPHLLVAQLRFARREFVRCLEGVSEEDGLRRARPMNSLGWMVGHLANQEHRYWVITAQDKNLAPTLNESVGYGRPASTPPLGEMWRTWRDVTAAADPFLDSLTPAIMETHFVHGGRTLPESVGTMLLRNLFHYWYHIGEASAVRQQFGHTDLPQFVGDMTTAPYRPEEP